MILESFSPWTIGPFDAWRAILSQTRGRSKTTWTIWGGVGGPKMPFCPCSVWKMSTQRWVGGQKCQHSYWMIPCSKHRKTQREFQCGKTWWYTPYYYYLQLVYDRNHLFGLGLILKPKLQIGCNFRPKEQFWARLRVDQKLHGQFVK